MLRIVLAIVMIAMLSPAAVAQRAKDGAAAVTAHNFVRGTTAANRFEVHSSQLALTRSLSPRVRQFARLMIRDHRQADRQLTATARKVGLGTPDGLDARHARSLGMLRNARGPEFERAYIDSQVDAHLRLVSLHRDYLRDARHPQVRRVAERWLPVFQEHLRMAQFLDARVAQR